jgi:hypothetical protein
MAVATPGKLAAPAAAPEARRLACFADHGQSDSRYDGSSVCFVDSRSAETLGQRGSRTDYAERRSPSRKQLSNNPMIASVADAGSGTDAMLPPPEPPASP